MSTQRMKACRRIKLHHYTLELTHYPLDSKTLITALPVYRPRSWRRLWNCCSVFVAFPGTQTEPTSSGPIVEPVGAPQTERTAHRMAIGMDWVAISRLKAGGYGPYAGYRCSEPGWQ